MSVAIACAEARAWLRHAGWEGWCSGGTLFSTPLIWQVAGRAGLTRGNISEQRKGEAEDISGELCNTGEDHL